MSGGSERLDKTPCNAQAIVRIEDIMHSVMSTKQMQELSLTVELLGRCLDSLFVRMAAKDYSAIVDKAVRVVEDFPKPGISFRDISTLLADPEAFQTCIDGLIESLSHVEFTTLAGIESRGFLFMAPLALHFKVKQIMVRKPNKLPGNKISYEYKKEYGSDILEIAEGVVDSSDKVVVIDDLLATGGSALAACKLIQQSGASVVACAFPIELGGLPGRELLEGESIEVHALLITK